MGFYDYFEFLDIESGRLLLFIYVYEMLLMPGLKASIRIQFYVLQLDDP